MRGTTSRSSVVICLGTLLLSCASVSTSEIHTYSLGDSELRVSARAERGATSDQLFIVVNDVDVASGPFGAEQAAGTTLRGTFEGTPVVARCGHRWRPGLHIGYRCSVSLGDGGPVELSF